MLSVSNPESFKWGELTLAECARGNSLDTYFTLKVYKVLTEKLEAQNQTKVVDELLFPLLPIFAEMEYNGIDVEIDNLEVVGRRLLEESVEFCDSLYDFKQVTRNHNMKSNDDVSEILFDDEYEKTFGLYPPIATDTRQPSVSRESLELLIEMIEEELKERE